MLNAYFLSKKKKEKKEREHTNKQLASFYIPCPNRASTYWLICKSLTNPYSLFYFNFLFEIEIKTCLVTNRFSTLARPRKSSGGLFYFNFLFEIKN